jgi:hypothetical protein
MNLIPLSVYKCVLSCRFGSMALLSDLIQSHYIWIGPSKLSLGARPILSPYVSCSKSHIHILSLRLFSQIIRPGSRFIGTFRNNLIFWRIVVSPTPNLEAGRKLLVGCPRLLIQCIRSYTPQLVAVPPSAIRGRAMLW